MKQGDPHGMGEGVDQVMLRERKSRKCAPEGTPPPGEGEEIKVGTTALSTEFN